MSGPSLREEPTRKSRSAKRITGLDAARGIALIGMMAIHVLPRFNDEFEPTVVWSIASGTSAALFALLAGVGLSLGARPGTHADPRSLSAARASLAIRAAAIAGIGLLLGQVDIPVSVILAYYGVMFAMAIPLLGLGARSLAACATGFATLGALSSWVLADSLPDLGEFDPTLYFLVSDTGSTLGTMFFTGAYPAIPWMAYLCAGLAIGKLDLQSPDTQLRVFLTGLFLAAGTALSSALLLGPLGGKDALVSSMRGWLDAGEVEEVLIWGPIDGVPLDSGWWQVALAPYSSTVFELFNTLGVAMAVLGAMLYFGDRLGWVMTPLCIVGSMTLTLYTLHVLFLATGVWEERPMLSLGMQVGAGLLFAVLWTNVSGRKRGPLEHAVAFLAGRARGRVPAPGNRSA